MHVCGFRYILIDQDSASYITGYDCLICWHITVLVECKSYMQINFDS